MKFRIIEISGTKCFIIQLKRKYLFWWTYAYDYANSIARYLDKQKEFYYANSTYTEAKEDLDLMVKYKMEYDKHKKIGKIVRDVVNFDDPGDRFIAGL